jgi:hypothetical protein
MFIKTFLVWAQILNHKLQIHLKANSKWTWNSVKILYHVSTFTPNLFQLSKVFYSQLGSFNWPQNKNLTPEGKAVTPKKNNNKT